MNELEELGRREEEELEVVIQKRQSRLHAFRCLPAASATAHSFSSAELFLLFYSLFHCFNTFKFFILQLIPQVKSYCSLTTQVT